VFIVPDQGLRVIEQRSLHKNRVLIKPSIRFNLVKYAGDFNEVESIQQQSPTGISSFDFLGTRI